MKNESSQPLLLIMVLLGLPLEEKKRQLVVSEPLRINKNSSSDVGTGRFSAIKDLREIIKTPSDTL
jgi:hypothetical protein